MSTSGVGEAPSGRDIAEVAAGTASAHDRAEVAAYRQKHPKGRHRVSKGAIRSSSTRRVTRGRRR